jgi:hypothetical protein
MDQISWNFGQLLCCEHLAAQVALAVGHGSSCGFLFLPGPNSGFLKHQTFFYLFGFILTRHLINNIHT